MMSATVALFVLRASISFCRNVGFLAISFSMTEIVRWSVSTTSTISVSDLLKIFGFHGLWLVNPLVGDMLVGLLCASASIEHARQNLVLMTAVQHYRNLIPRAWLISLC